MRLWRSLLGGGASGQQQEVEERSFPFDQWNTFSFNGVSYPIFTATTASDRETIANDFPGYTRSLYEANGVVFACMVTRQLVFSEIRFLWQQLNQGQPGDLFGTRELGVLERPWPNGDTGELLSRMIQDVDLSGNFFAIREDNREGSRLRRLRPDWVEVALDRPPDEAVQSNIHGYVYHPGGMRGKSTPVTFAPWQVAHWAPIPDPQAQYRGMSWLTPILREVESDSASTLHKKKFFDNAATPNIAVSLSDQVTKEEFGEFVEAMDASHRGAHNAYKTLYLGGGADVKTIGSDMQQMDFKATQGASETRIAAAARVHPVVVGLSEGLQGSSLNAGNFNSARRSFVDGTMRPLWRSATAALETILTPPSSARLWYDTSDVAYLQEDRKDMADIQQSQSRAVRELTEAGYEPTSVVDAVTANDLNLLSHTGVFSVQLQPPATGTIDSAGVDGGDEGE